MLVGRKRELSELDAHLSRMIAGQGSVLFITGEAGLGKTTLVHEWWAGKSHTESGEPRADKTMFVEADCSIPIGGTDVGELEAFQPWADIVGHLHEETGKGMLHRTINLKRLLHDSAPAWAWALPLVGDIAHAVAVTHRLVKEQRGELDGNPNAANQQQVFQQYVNLLTRIAEDVPLVIYLDDMHWSDVSSTNLLFYLARQITSKRILVIVAYRLEDARAANKGEGHPILSVRNEIVRYGAGKEIALEFLSTSAISDLLHRIFPGYRADPQFEEWIHAISEGNSLFVTEFIKILREDNLLDELGSFVGRYDEVIIPSSVVAVLDERTRRLDKETRDLVRYASVEGEEFTMHVLEQLARRPMLDMLRCLRDAERIGVIREAGTTTIFGVKSALFRFTHALFQKVLYDSLMEAERLYLHGICLQALRKAWDESAAQPERLVPLGSKLILHAEKFGEWTVAADAGLAMARVQRESFANDEALRMLGKVLWHMENAAREGQGTDAHRASVTGQAHLQRATVLQLRGEYDQALHDYGKARSVLAVAGETAGVIDAMNGEATVYSMLTRYDEAEARASEAMALARSAGYAKGEAYALRKIGTVQHERGAYADAMEYHQRSLDMAELMQDRVAQAKSLTSIGKVYEHYGDLQAALEHYEKSLDICQTIGDREREAIVLLSMGKIHERLDEIPVALEYYHRSLDIFVTIQHRHGQAEALSHIGRMRRKMGDAERSAKHLEDALRIAREIGARELSATALGELALLLVLEEEQRETGPDGAKLLKAVTHIEETLRLLREIKHADAGRWEMELAALKTKLDK